MHRLLPLAAIVAILIPLEARAAGTTPATAVVAGGYHACALTKTGGVKCWGANYYGEVGDGTNKDRHTAVAVSGLQANVVALVAGDNHTCALTKTGGVKCWGMNDHGQLGDGTVKNRNKPVAVQTLASGVAAIAAKGFETCAVTTSGAVKCWGKNSDGQVGDGSKTDRHKPVAVKGLQSNVAVVAVGGFHACALTTGGGVRCWGYNGGGALGNGTQTSSSTPVQVSGMTHGIGAITTGNSHSCALTTAGVAKCWGDNVAGGLGDGTTANRKSPVSVKGLGVGVKRISAGYEFTCAVTSATGMKCWGIGG